MAPRKVILPPCTEMGEEPVLPYKTYHPSMDISTHKPFICLGGDATAVALDGSKEGTGLKIMPLLSRSIFMAH